MSPIAAKACPACRAAYIAERAGVAAGPPGVYTYIGKTRSSALRRAVQRAANPASRAQQVTLCPRRAFDLAFGLAMSAALARFAACFAACFCGTFHRAHQSRFSGTLDCTFYCTDRGDAPGHPASRHGVLVDERRFPTSGFPTTVSRRAGALGPRAIGLRAVRPCSPGARADRRGRAEHRRAARAAGRRDRTRGNRTGRARPAEETEACDR